MTVVAAKLFTTTATAQSIAYAGGRATDIRIGSPSSHCDDWRCAIAHNAALQAATAVLAAAGYRELDSTGRPG
jgi:hypothetical protein